MMTIKKIDWSSEPKVVSFLGNESFFKDRELARAKILLPNHHYESYVGGDDDEELEPALLEATASFLSMKKLIVVRDANKIKNQKLLKAYCKNPSTDKVVVFVSTDRGRDAKWFKSLKVVDTLKCDTIKDWNLGEWLVEEANQRGLRLKKDFAEAIVMNVGNSLPSLSNELDKVAIYCGERKIIEPEDIQAVLYSQSALSPFEIVRHWGLGNKNVALQFMARHFEKTPETQWVRSELVIIRGFFDRIENLLKARSLRDAGTGDSQIAAELGLSKWIFDNKVSDQISTRNIEELLKAYRTICDVEAKSKMGKPGRLLLQSFIIHN